ncbi:nicotinamidase-related amidase [Sphingomonas sp. SORGH_AS 950]|uniref:hydrolase n=1 Tax=Sphingomonas sp. SORGH_AS_0950 TaxID=3041792 RepID=UPI00278A8AE5|nr:hydrolase [Sphingomonas sp. SORGH_AS_0950]MDQ1158109.1 nicotinamidase-related amidase [Sphingomonas sp. SORGH_AS_0950]
MTTLDPATTALILIDLQRGIVPRAGGPRSGDEVVGTAKTLAARFRAAGAPVVLVHVGFTPETMPSQTVDRPSLPPEGTPPDFSELVPGLAEPGDIVVLKHHWGAFTGTDLDLQLRRRGVRTVVIAGISTNMGVESTARSAWELSYDVVIAEDACASQSSELHAFAVDHILPLIARVVASGDIRLEG